MAHFTLTVHTTRTITAPEYGTALDIGDIKALLRDTGSHFFDAGTMRYFRSRVAEGVIAGAEGWYFVTSEQHERLYGGMDARKYTVRRVWYRRDDSGQPVDVDIETASDFQAYPTLGQARTAARRLAAGTMASAA